MNEFPLLTVIVFGVIGLLCSVIVVHRNENLLHHCWFLLEQDFWKETKVTPVYLLFLLLCGTFGGALITISILRRIGAL